MSGAVDLSSLKQPPAGAGPSGGHAVTEADFEAKVLRRSTQVPVVVALYSQRSPGSIELVELLERLVGEANGTWDLAAVEAESNMRIAQAFGVQGIPTVIAVAAGQPLADFQGAQPEPQVRQWLDAVVQAVEGKLEGGGGQPQRTEDPRFSAAEALLEQGDLAGAESAYAAILEQEPNNTEAKAALRQVRFLSRVQSLPDSAIATADADPSNVAAALDAADVELYHQQPEAAFDRLIGLIKRTSGDDRTQVRTRLLELFELFDQAEPFVVAARRKLATALY
ncbi:tetratricopeptide repeat protein [Nocardia donostiensis]|uniref:Co-chaperone YbbN n=1 Tax=Nocardia donostiensis TaxID=1538463 RepID=A0A1W0BES8_9NOCA|nr:tetratricopeptide repeat protein [Nocardia donostiensis]ONM47228.1 co-chaperone YbbN [Nocardia donostiensis]OQS16532.1 co-chaperone YbbN [Nocardia donostiensis]OQS21007.1 co-chaperone YbbN [Nocardia donostiensis]